MVKRGKLFGPLQDLTLKEVDVSQPDKYTYQIKFKDQVLTLNRIEAYCLLYKLETFKYKLEENPDVVIPPLKGVPQGWD